MISAWTRHLKNEEEKERFKNTVLGSKEVLDRLQELLNEIEGELTNTELSTKVYAVPNWDYMQADINGSRRILRTVSKIINLDQKDKNESIPRPTNTRPPLLYANREPILPNTGSGVTGGVGGGDQREHVEIPAHASGTSEDLSQAR